MSYKIVRYQLDFNHSRSDLRIRLPNEHRILAFGPSNFRTYSYFDTKGPYMDILMDPQVLKSEYLDQVSGERRFIILPVGSELCDRNLLRHRNLLGSFIAPDAKQCYVFEGGMVGV
jgi:hypothetical protein